MTTAADDDNGIAVHDHPDGPIHVSFVCTGNICRSPMAANIVAHALRDEGLADAVRVTSAGTDGWHVGEPADERAAAVLARHGYPTDHRAARVAAEHLAADLLVPLAIGHDRQLAHLGVPNERRRLLRSFDPDADTDSVADPYYGDLDDFETVRREVEAALPGLVEWIRARVEDRTPEHR
ncbi:low molecular weight protein-tyrosine-phosphatase [Rhodococcus sp. HNM0569]|uniref:low molecular weight protein-tyrosine-phosphatase n=1 Tax=Rhodococcus sp. HNM0569 TaxID=2716340 RepID=UPI00146A543B|nr:low molecular weight protein-tyrosine-phosphatase [Rhodococcus sp. HNM0569]NLU82838.1 low molecular weight phosphotyrosine protein phosphatase [Rhodococcus sp. HNM0569]